ncbi:hypothetical protein GCM10022252_16840 [Streptosporangium oxazolinicum]|uniref:Oxygen sensor histidine kinase NreB n=2 Tax=Streptosporangium oxazolinicum TaxID=909287 RepID=A0ABP8ALK5_9ACTN
MSSALDCVEPAGLPLAFARAVSRDLHDRVAHAIVTGLNLLELSEHYRRTGAPELAQDRRERAEQVLRQTLGVTRELSARLRTACEEDEKVWCPDAEAEPPDARCEEVFLIVREALDNAMTHAGAEHVTVHLSTELGQLVASVRDDGGGFPAERAGSPTSLGLQSMRERAMLLGGTFLVASHEGAGTQVLLTVPLR